jgi:hypothetical protein
MTTQQRKRRLKYIPCQCDLYRVPHRPVDECYGRIDDEEFNWTDWYERLERANEPREDIR